MIILLSKEVIGKYKVSSNAVIFADIIFFLSIGPSDSEVGKVVEGGIKEQEEGYA